jgi:hypothetical protein
MEDGRGGWVFFLFMMMEKVEWSKIITQTELIIRGGVEWSRWSGVAILGVESSQRGPKLT